MTVAIGEMLSPTMAAKRLDRTRQRVDQLIRAGRLPALHTPVGRLIDPAAVDAIIAARERETTVTNTRVIAV